MFLCLQMTMRQSTRWFISVLAVLVVVGLASCTKAPPPLRQPTFDQQRAFRRLEELCSFGPRNHGSQGKTRAEQWIQQTLRDAGIEVQVHEFQYTPKGSTQAETFRNIVGRIKPELKERILVATHYDTRSTADKDPDESRRNQPIPGANDGGSGVALLLEMAVLWKGQPPPVGVDVIFFDGEDFGRGNDLDEYFLGSKAYTRDFPEYKPVWGIVLDMVGDESLGTRKERDSVARAPQVVERVWSAATRVGSNGFLDERGGLIYDDHTTFLNKGIPVVLVIDFNYPSFHTTADTLDKCSADSLGQVGRAVMEAVEAPIK